MHESGVSNEEDIIRDDLKRFRKEYSKPVQFRYTFPRVILQVPMGNNLKYSEK